MQWVDLVCMKLEKCIYASNTVNDMITEKAVSTYMCGHKLVDASLNTILIADSYITYQYQQYRIQ